jgi:hypothetical protein
MLGRGSSHRDGVNSDEIQRDLRVTPTEVYGPSHGRDFQSKPGISMTSAFHTTEAFHSSSSLAYFVDGDDAVHMETNE